LFASKSTSIPRKGDEPEHQVSPSDRRLRLRTVSALSKRHGIRPYSRIRGGDRHVTGRAQTVPARTSRFNEAQRIPYETRSLTLPCLRHPCSPPAGLGVVSNMLFGPGSRAQKLSLTEEHVNRSPASKHVPHQNTLERVAPTTTKYAIFIPKYFVSTRQWP
jgi:hypothetical protein